MPFLLAERAHSESARSMRAVKGNLGYSLEQMLGPEEKMEPDDLLCSRNARPRKALVGRAQLSITGSHPWRGCIRASLEGSSLKGGVARCAQ